MEISRQSKYAWIPGRRAIKCESSPTFVWPLVLSYTGQKYVCTNISFKHAFLTRVRGISYENYYVLLICKNKYFNNEFQVFKELNQKPYQSKLGL